MRNGFLLKLRPGGAGEYRARHADIRPEMLRALRTAGVSDYTIWLDSRSGLLFAQRRIETPEKLGGLRRAPAFRQWQEHMADLLEQEPDGSGPVSIPLEEVFHME